MKDILHLKNILYSKKYGFIINQSVKDIELFIKHFTTKKDVEYNQIVKSPLVVIDTLHSCFVHGIVDSIFPLHWIINDIDEEEGTKQHYRVFVRKRHIEKYPDENLKNIDEEKSVFKGVYGELMDLCTDQKIMFEHLLKEDDVYLIKNVYFSKLESNNQRSLWNNGEHYPGRYKGKQIFTDLEIQRRYNLFLEEVVNFYEIKKDVTFKKRIVIIDRKTYYRSFKKTWLHNDNITIDTNSENHISLLDNLNHILTKQEFLTYNGVKYLEDFSMKEQMELFINNDIIVTPHGANMVHSLWCNNKIIVEVLYDKEKAGMYKRLLSFTDNKLAQISPYNIEEFLKLLIFRFKPQYTELREEPNDIEFVASV